MWPAKNYPGLYNIFKKNPENDSVKKQNVPHRKLFRFSGSPELPCIGKTPGPDLPFTSSRTQYLEISTNFICSYSGLS
jgi:hypothetical protein